MRMVIISCLLNLLNIRPEGSIHYLYSHNAFRKCQESRGERDLMRRQVRMLPLQSNHSDHVGLEAQPCSQRPTQDKPKLSCLSVSTYPTGMGKSARIDGRAKNRA